MYGMRKQANRGTVKAKTPKVFTEQGVAMLSAVLKSQTAVLVSVAIMDAFVKMRHFMISNAEVVCRMNVLEKRQIATDAKVDEILQRIDVAEPPLQGIFYQGRYWDAKSLLIKFIRRAKKELVVIDAYVGVANGECCHCENVASSQFQSPIEEAA